MYPEILRIGSFTISSFGLMLVLAFVAAYFQLSWGLRRTGAGNEEDASSILFAAGLAGIAGAKIYYAVLYRDWHLLFDRSGLVWYGGFLAGSTAVLWVLHRRRLPPWPTADAVAPALALGYGIGRIGCFLVGDDYGMPTTLPWGVKFPHGLPPTRAGELRAFGAAVPPEVPDNTLLAVHPTQIYEAVLGVAICAVGVALLRRRLRPGTTALVVLALLAVERFGIEMLRAKDDRFLGPFTLAQMISLGVLVAIVALWPRRPRPAGGHGTGEAGGSSR
jgi:phosphatidylglycerol:prolipoprotein diacylglycerol transferase